MQTNIVHSIGTCKATNTACIFCLRLRQPEIIYGILFLGLPDTAVLRTCLPYGARNEVLSRVIAQWSFGNEACTFSDGRSKTVQETHEIIVMMCFAWRACTCFYPCHMPGVSPPTKCSYCLMTHLQPTHQVYPGLGPQPQKLFQHDKSRSA